jgi:hypothetical protein
MNGFNRLIVAAVLLLSLAEHSSAQTATDVSPTAGVAAQKADRIQPQGPTGPITTKSGGAPAESPQGETPPGMQAAPQGSGGSIPARPAGQSEGTPK